MGVGRPRRRRRGNQLLGARGEGDSGLHFPGGPARDRKCPEPLNGRRGFARLVRAVVPGACGSRCCSVSVHLGPSRTAAGWPRRVSETPDSAASHRGSGVRARAGSSGTWVRALPLLLPSFALSRASPGLTFLLLGGAPSSGPSSHRRWLCRHEISPEGASAVEPGAVVFARAWPGPPPSRRGVGLAPAAPEPAPRTVRGRVRSHCAKGGFAGPPRAALGEEVSAGPENGPLGSEGGTGGHAALRRLSPASAACLLKRLARLARPPPCSLPGSKEPDGMAGGRFYLSALALSALGSLCVLFIVYWMWSWHGGFAWDGSILTFNCHPVLMVAGMVVVYSAASLVYRLPQSWVGPKLPWKIAHASLHLLAFVLTVLGLVAVFRYHNNKHIANLYSLHSWLGITTVFFFACQWLLGFAVFLLPWASLWLRSLLKPVHVFFGASILALALASVISGINEKLFFSLKNATRPYSSLPGEAVFANGTGMLVVAFGLLVLYVLQASSWKRPEVGITTEGQPLLRERE